MRFHNFTARICVIFAVLIPLIAGCSSFSTLKKTTKKIVRDIKTPDGNLKKKVGIALFENRTFYVGKNLEEIFQNNLVKTIKQECPDIFLLKPGDAQCPDFLIELPGQAAGRLDNLALAKAGKRLGLSAIVTGALTDIRENEEKSGILWFKDTHNFVQVQIMVEVYDTETGAKLLDESYLHEIEIDKSEFESIGAKKKIVMPAITDAIKRIAVTMGEKICDVVSIQSWKGYVVSVAKDKIIISSGRRAGILRGDVFEIYNNNNIIEGAGGRQFFKYGNKTGEIKITNVYPERAEAVSVSCKDINVGNSVKTKK